ncbi:MMPL family transporter [Nocardia cyriacigeorgica]|uniref:MMPL family transporter n=1 Tax=Nocardia cyriacigeorgica TaxID=135487 RepID=UPI0018932690|nr:MMPL family transporter [Nocardia cyriacigeorgica]MBF6157814.1 MMPL family transporter [Nocardia cyriacigeorgica]MBF6196786.1 MMPL family transporter [Nocardia cyriacigeorgica]MBF6343900.1 MMPL family transporter [Nocardia cyriacigeorgica]
MDIWSRYASTVSSRRSWWLLVVLAIAAIGVIGGVGENESAGEAPNSLPDGNQSAQIEHALAQFPDAGSASAVIVVSRADGAALTEADLTAAREAVARARSAEPGDVRVITAPDGAAAIAEVPVAAELSGFALTEEIDRLRTVSTTGLPGALNLEVTGGPAFGADIADSFSGANATLLAVTAAVVAILLIVTYRSPVLWLIPLLIVGLADRVATSVGTGLAKATDLSFDGSTSGITSVLVFGAGTNYALLLVSRYRDELRREPDHRRALWQACRRAGPAILASNLTVVAALLILLVAAVPSTRSLGASAAAGLLVVVLFVLFGLPAALALFGRKVFWPFIPEAGGPDSSETGIWHAIATRVVARRAVVATSATAALVVCAAGLFTVDVGLSQTEQFRVQAESVAGFDTLATHFPAGTGDPAVVVARSASAARVEQVLTDTPGVQRVTRTGTSDTGLTRWAVVIDAPPESERAFDQVESIRERVAEIPDADALVGGSDAQALDTRDAASGDRAVIMPLILVVVLLILIALLRAIPAALVLVAVTVLSALAALGVGSWVSVHLFGFPAIDTNVPLFAFLFLVALGVDYSIFLVVRAREETPEHGTTQGIVRAVSTTGTVITSAGLVLAAVFCVLGVLPLITLTQLGIVVGLGILLDTFIVRTIIIPALFATIGDRIWWPSKPVTSSAAEHETVAADQ